MVEIRWDEAALKDLLHSLDGPVGRYITEKAAELTASITIAAPLQKRRNWSWNLAKSTAYEPASLGYLKGSVRMKVGYTKAGQLYGGTNAAYGPSLFLEQPAEQLHHKIPFMSASLYALSV